MIAISRSRPLFGRHRSIPSRGGRPSSSLTHSLTHSRDRIGPPHFSPALLPAVRPPDLPIYPLVAKAGRQRRAPSTTCVRTYVLCYVGRVNQFSRVRILSGRYESKFQGTLAWTGRGPSSELDFSDDERYFLVRVSAQRRHKCTHRYFQAFV